MAPVTTTGGNAMKRVRTAAGALAVAGTMALAACTASGISGGNAARAAGNAVAGAASSATSSTASSSSTSANTTYDANTDPLVQMVRRVEPAVVNVTSTVVQDSPFGQRQGTAVGTGFIVDSAGFIVTNDHVVESARSIRVTLPDGRAYSARVVVADSPHDLAVLKIDATGLPTVSL